MTVMSVDPRIDCGDHQGPDTTGGSARRRTAAAAVATAVLLGAGCAAMAKRDAADLLRAAPELVLGKRSAVGTLRSTVAVKQVRLGAAPPQVRPAVTDAVRLDLTRKRASVDGPVAGGGTLPLTQFSEDIVYQRRLGQAGEGTTQGRAWVKLSFQSLYDRRDGVRGTGLGYAGAWNPTYMVDVLRGTLTGSVERRGDEDVAGTATTRYDVRFGLDKAYEDVPERRRQGLEAYFAISAVSLTRTAEGRVWMAADGLPRRIEVTLSQRGDVDERFDVTYVLELHSYGDAVDIHLPKRKEIATVDGMGPVLAATSTNTSPTAAPVIPGLTDPDGAAP